MKKEYEAPDCEFVVFSAADALQMTADSCPDDSCPDDCDPCYYLVCTGTDVIIG